MHYPLSSVKTATEATKVFEVILVFFQNEEIFVQLDDLDE